MKAVALLTIALSLLSTTALDARPAARTPAPLPLRLGCSTSYGCIVTIGCHEILQKVGVTDSNFDVQVLSDGSGQDIRIGVLPKVALETRDNIALPPAARLDVVTKGDNAYSVMLDAVPFQPLETKALPCTTHPRAIATHPMPAPTPLPESPSDVDLTKIDSRFVTHGDAALACTSVFGYRGQVWCKLPVTAQGLIPSAYAIDPAGTRPLSTHVADRDWLVIDTMPNDIRLTWGTLNRSIDILRRGL